MLGCTCSDITVFLFVLVSAERVSVFVPWHDLNDCSCSVNIVQSQSRGSKSVNHRRKTRNQPSLKLTRMKMEIAGGAGLPCGSTWLRSFCAWTKTSQQ